MWIRKAKLKQSSSVDLGQLSLDFWTKTKQSLFHFSLSLWRMRKMLQYDHRQRVTERGRYRKMKMKKGGKTHKDSKDDITGRKTAWMSSHHHPFPWLHVGHIIRLITPVFTVLMLRKALRHPVLIEATGSSARESSGALKLLPVRRSTSVIPWPFYRSVQVSTCWGLRGGYCTKTMTFSW